MSMAFFIGTNSNFFLKNSLLRPDLPWLTILCFNFTTFIFIKNGRFSVKEITINLSILSTYFIL